MNYKFDGAKVYFTSDTHFNHANIIGFCSRPFKNVNEMNETLIANWNRVVGVDDIVFHLGDFCLGGSAEWTNVLNRNIGYNQINLQLFLLFSQIRCSAFLQNALPRLITANILNRSLNFMAFATTPYALPSAIFLS